MITGCVNVVGPSAAYGLSLDNLAALFHDKGFRYAEHPYETEEGVYVYRKYADFLGRTTSYGGKMVSLRALPSYMALPKTDAGNPVYCVGFQTAISLPSGYYFSAVNHFIEEDIPGSGYNQENYFRFTIGYQTLTDSPLMLGAGLSGALVGLPEVGDNSSTNGTLSGIGGDFELYYMCGRSFMLKAAISPAIASGGDLLIDAEASVGYFTGPMHYFIGYRALYWPDSEFKGFFAGIGIWF